MPSALGAQQKRMLTNAGTILASSNLSTGEIQCGNSPMGVFSVPAILLSRKRA